MGGFLPRASERSCQRRFEGLSAIAAASGCPVVIRALPRLCVGLVPEIQVVIVDETSMPKLNRQFAPLLSVGIDPELETFANDHSAPILVRNVRLDD